MALYMARVFALYFLQEHDVGIQFAQALAQFMQYHAPVELRKAFMDVVGGDLEGVMGGILPNRR